MKEMKIDISSIVVILFSLLFIFLGGLSKRRKKSQTARSNVLYKQVSGPKPSGTEFLKDAVTMINNPFDKLEKMFEIPEPTYNQEGESLEVEAENVPGSLEVTDIKASSMEVTSDKESQSLETIVDEVAEYMKEKDKSISGSQTVKPFDDNDLTRQERRKASVTEEKSGIPLILFKDFDDFKKAVIYSEILNRKEY